MAESEDLFQPQMPEIEPRADIASVFATARREVIAGGPEKGLATDQRCIGIVTPGRLVMFVPAPAPGSITSEQVAQAKQVLFSEKPLNITVVGYTRLDALMKDKAKCIPFLGHLLSFAYIGHHVVVFEGHPAVFEPGVQDSDVLLIDSGMLPFLQKDWVDAAVRVMPPGGRIFIHSRQSYRLMPVVKSKNPPGWRYSEPDGEASYVNCLLTTLAKGLRASVQIGVRGPVPNLAELTTDAAQLEWISELPFRYETLKPVAVIGIILKAAGWTLDDVSKSSGVLKAQLATKGGQRQVVSFQLTLGKIGDKIKHLQIDFDPGSAS